MALKLSNNYLRRVRDLPGISGLAGLGRGSDRASVFRSFPAPSQLGGQAQRASLTTALTGTNNDLVWTAVDRGTQGNSIRVTYTVSGASTPLSVSVSNKDINVIVGTNGSSVAVSTAAQVAAAVAASTPASRLVTTTNAAGNDGTGVVTALAQTNLSGGTDYKFGK